MGRRREKRVPAIVPVRMWGTDREGTPFCEYVCTVDITSTGARVAGVRVSLSVGDTVGLQCRHRQARFRISWIGQRYTPTGTQIGLHCLEPDKDLWQIAFAGNEPDDYVLPEVRSRKYEVRERETRRSTRYPLVGKAYVSNLCGEEGICAKLEDISLTGCYVTTAHPFGVGRRISLLLQAGNTEIKAYGVVRVCYPHRAMGVEFVQLAPVDVRALRSLVSYLEEIENALNLLTARPEQPQSCPSALS